MDTTASNRCLKQQPAINPSEQSCELITFNKIQSPPEKEPNHRGAKSVVTEEIDMQPEIDTPLKVQEFLTNSLLNKYTIILDTKTKQRRFRCNDCAYNTTLKRNLIAHLQSHTGDKCVCQDGLTRPVKLRVKGKPYACTICGYRTGARGNLKRHLALHEGHTKAVSPTSERKVDMKVASKNDLQERTVTQCADQSIESETPAPILLNTTNHHINPNFLVSENLILREERQQSDDDQALKDDDITLIEVIEKKSYLINVEEQHLQSEETFEDNAHIELQLPVTENDAAQEATAAEVLPGKEKPHQCTVCDFRTAYKRILRDHMCIHSGEKPHACTECGYRAAHIANVRRHMKIHTGEKPYACTQCEYRAAHKNSLNLHVASHTGQKLYACSQCSYQAVVSDLVQRHINYVHMEDKLFVCNECGYRTNRKRDFKLHEACHTGEKPHVCEVCEYRTANKSSWKRHMKIHSRAGSQGSREKK